jgi:hypothetical protein
MSTVQYTFFSAAHGIFSKIHHILSHKASLNKYKKSETTLCIVSDHKAIKLEFNNNKNQQKILKQLEAEQYTVP